MKKKLLALVLSAIMLMGLSITAFAGDTDSISTSSIAVTVTKTVDITNGGSAPCETYKFTVTEDRVEGAAAWAVIPDIKDFCINGSGSCKIYLPVYTSVGTYYYTIKEKAGNTAGVVYDDEEYTLKVTVTRKNLLLVRSYLIYNKDGEKVDKLAFNNKYNAGSLTITKDVTGNLGDTGKEFSFTVTFWDEDEACTWVNAINVEEGGASNVVVSGNTVTFTLSDDDSITFDNIPAGISYSVKEDDYAADGYTTVYDENSSGTMTGEDVTTVITNSRNVDIDTGISLDNLPYIMILVIVILGAALVIFRRRHFDRY